MRKDRIIFQCTYIELTGAETRCRPSGISKAELDFLIKRLAAGEIKSIKNIMAELKM